MMQPKRTKFRKYQKNRPGGSMAETSLHFGSYGIKAGSDVRLTAKVLETARRVLTRTFKRSGKIWIRVFPDLSISQKPNEVRMGKGKGAPAYWVVPLKKNQLIFEMDGIPKHLAQTACRKLTYKMPIPIVFVEAPTR